MADPGKMSAHDFAAYIKKQMPEFANYPDDELVKGILARRPDLRSRIIMEPPPPKGMPLADSAWGRMKQAYEGTLPILDYDQATLSGVGSVARGTVDAVKGLAGMLKPPSQEEVMESIKTFPEGFPITILARRMMQPAEDVAKMAPQVPGAIHDINASPDPLGTYARAAQDTAGQGAGQAITALAAEGARAGISKLREPLTPEQAARRITDAVNPVAKTIPGYQEALTKHLNKIMEFADRRGLKINSLESLTKAMQGSGLELKNYWYDKILGPVKANKVQISGIPGYAGKADGAVATLGDLDARLSQINAELNPKFAKEGVAAQAAVKSAADLNAEAAAIRKVLYPELSKVTGISAEELSNTRQAFGSLRDLGDKTQLAASKARYATNYSKNAPKSFNPFSKTKEFVADEALRAMRGDISGKSISKTVQRTKVPKYEYPSVKNSPTTTAPVRRTPMWQMGEDELEMLRRRGPGGEPPKPTVFEQAEKVSNLKFQIERAQASGTQPYGLISQLRQLEEDLANSTKEAWGKQYSESPAQPGQGKTAGGANYTAEQLAELKKKWGIQ